jgi:hypothetical protein
MSGPRANVHLLTEPSAAGPPGPSSSSGKSRPATAHARNAPLWSHLAGQSGRSPRPHRGRREAGPASRPAPRRGRPPVRTRTATRRSDTIPMAVAVPQTPPAFARVTFVNGLAACGDNDDTAAVRVAAPSVAGLGSDQRLANQAEQLARASASAGSDQHLSNAADEIARAQRANQAASARLAGEAERQARLDGNAETYGNMLAARPKALPRRAVGGPGRCQHQHRQGVRRRAAAAKHRRRAEHGQGRQPWRPAGAGQCVPATAGSGRQQRPGLRLRRPSGRRSDATVRVRRLSTQQRPADIPVRQGGPLHREEMPMRASAFCQRSALRACSSDEQPDLERCRERALPPLRLRTGHTRASLMLVRDGAVQPKPDGTSAPTGPTHVSRLSRRDRVK